MIQADFVIDKKALPVEDANTAFSLGLWQKIDRNKYSRFNIKLG
jgi:hypothetical protein